MKIPALVSRIGPRIPAPMLSLPFAAGLEFARARRWLVPPAELNGRSFALHITDLGARIRFRCESGSFRPLLSGTPELELSATMKDFLALMRGSADADTLFFQRRLGIRGDTELGLIVKNWLDASDRPAWLQRFAPQD